MKTIITTFVIVAVCTIMVTYGADMKKVPEPRLARGLNAEIAKKFSDDYKTFTCDNGATVLSVDAVNDDYCDCADSSDEYGTTACPKGTFYCRNKFYTPSYLPSGQLDDGVCDCCDGTDEPAGACKNNCKELGAERRKAVLQRKDDVEIGLKKREEMAKEGAQVLIDKKKELAELEEAIKAKKPEEDKARKESDEKNEAFKKKDEELRKIQEENRQKAEAEKKAKEMAEKEKMVVEGAPNADINEMVHAGEDKVDTAEVKEADEEHAAPTHLDDNEEEKEPEMKVEDDPEWKALNEAKDKARTALNDIISQIRDLEDKKNEAQRILDMKVDNDMCLVKLGTECVEMRDKFLYKICPIHNAKQDSTDLGRFKSWEGPETTPLAKRQMKFDDGAHCWDGPNRNTLVTLRCGAENRIISVSEPSRCTYLATMETPCACSKEDLDQAIADINAMLADEAED